MKKIILSIRNWIRHHRHPDENVILVTPINIGGIQNRFWSRYKTRSLPRMTPGRITIIFSALFISFLSIIMFRNQISTFFQAAGADPVAYWKFDEGQGSTAYDAVGSNNGTLGTGNSAPSWISEDQCISGKCLRFDGTNDTVSLTPFNSITNQITVEAWVRPSNVTGINTVISNWDSPSSNAFILFSDYTSSKPRFRVGPSGSDNNVDATTSLIANQWYYLAGVYDGSTVKIYVNGMQEGSVAASGNLLTTNDDADIGSYGGGNFYKGTIDGVKIYNYARTAAQIKADYDARGSTKGVAARFGDDDLSRKLSSGLVGHWKMDENTGTTLSDSSGNQISGTFPLNVSASYVKSVEFVEITLTTTETTDSVNLTKGQVITNSVPFVTSKVNINGVAGADDDFRAILVDVYFESGPNRVTATRTQGDASFGQIDVGVYVVEFDSSFVSVQQGTFSMTSIGTGSTAPITAVNQSKAAMVLYFRSNPPTAAEDDYSDNSVAGWFSANDTLSFQRDTADGEINGHYYVFEAQNSEFSVQASTFSIGSGSTLNTATITSVDTSKSFVIGSYRTSANTDNSNEGALSIYLNSATQVGASRQGTSSAISDIRTFVVTFPGDELVQRGTFAYASNDGQEIYSSLTAVDLNYAIAWNPNMKQGNMENNGIDTSDVMETFQHLQLTSATTIQGDRYAVDASVASGRWEVIKFAASSGDGPQPTWAAGKFGPGLEFDGSNDYASMGDITNFDGATSLTISTWIYADTTPAGSTINSIISKGDYTGASSDSFLVRLRGTEGVRASFSDGTNQLNCDTTDMPATGVWVHIAAVLYPDKSCKVFLNGEIEGTNTIAAFNGIANTVHPLRLASSEYSSEGYFNGKMDDVRIYNRALDPSEVKALYEWAPGPVGWWKLDEGSGSRYDSSGNANTLTDNNTVLSARGKYGKGADFENKPADGSENLNISDASQSMLDINGTAALTVEAWVKTESTEGDVQAIAGKDGTAGNRGYWLHWGASDNIRFLISNDGTATTTITGSTALTTNTWYHFAAVYDSSNLSVYLNGISDATPMAYSSGIFDSSAPFAIGGRGSVSQADTFDGQIDEVKVYNYARTQKQIISDMNAGHPSVGSPVGSAVGYWKFDEGYGNTVNNSGNVGSTANGTLGTGSSAPSWTNDGKFGKALSFDGTSDYASVADSASLRFDDASSDFSVFAWVKRSVSGAVHYVVSKEDADNDGWRLQIDSGNTITCSTGVTDVTSTATITDTNWHHIGCTIDRGGNGQAYLDATATGGAVSVGSTAMATTTALNIGSRSYTRTNFFNGSIDEVKIYSFALTADEVKVEYNSGKAIVLGANSTGVGGTTPSFSSDRSYCVPGDASTCNPPVGEWKFDMKIGSSAPDTSGNGNVGSLAGGPKWVAGKQGNALKFDGDDDYVGLGTITNLSPTTAVSVSAWIKTNGTIASAMQIFDRLETGDGYGLNLSNTGKVQFSLNGGIVLPTGTTDVDDGNWHYVVGTYDSAAGGTTEAKVYVDGKLDATADYSTAIDYSPEPRKQIGRLNTGSYFNGLIDQVSIYNYARTPAQIAWEYNRGAPVAWYKFDECTGTTAYDWGQNANGGYNGNNGTLHLGSNGVTSAGTCTTSGAWYNGATGKRESSMSFDGSDDYVLISKTSTSNEFPEVSVSAWINPATLSDDDYPRIFQATGSSEYKIVLYGLGPAYAPSGSQGKIEFYIDNISGCGVRTGVVPLNQWSHVLATYDGSNTKMFFNGKLVDTRACSQGNIDVFTQIDIGGYSTSMLNRAWRGQIDDVKLWNYALTPAQVKDAMNSGAVRFE